MICNLISWVLSVSLVNMFVAGLLFEHVTMAMMMAVVVHTTQRVVVMCVHCAG